MLELFRLLGTIAVDNTAANNSLDNTTGKAEKSEGKISKAFKKIGAAVVTYFSVSAIVNFGKACITAASDVEEMENKFNVVFEGMSEEVDAWADDYATAIGRNKNNIKEYLADNQNMFVGMGMTREEGAKLSENLVTLALDLASFNNLNEDDAVNAMSKAIMGETESAKSLGAVLNDNTRALAMEQLGYTGKFDSLTEAQKMEVNYQAILNQSADAVGDCERSVDSYKGRQIQLQSALQSVKEKIGQLLLPLATLATKFGVSGVDAISKFIDKMSNADQRAQLFRDILHKLFDDEFINTLEEWVGYFKDVIGLFADDAVSTFSAKLGDVKELFSNLKAILQPFVETVLLGLINGFDNFLAVYDAIQPFISFLIDAFFDISNMILTNITPALTRINEKFQELQQYVSAVVQNVILPVISEFIAMIQDLYMENQDKIQKIGELFSVVFNRIADLVAWFVEMFKNYIYPFLLWLAETVRNNMDKVKAVFQSVFDIVGGIVDFFIALFKGDWEGMWNAILKILNGAKDLLSNLFNLIWSILKEIWNKLKDSIVSITSKLKDTVVGWFQKLKDGIQEKIQAAKDKVTEIFQKLKEAAIEHVAKLYLDAKEKFENIKKAITEPIEKAKDFVKEQLDKIKGFFSGLEFKLPDIKLPHFSLEGEFSLNPPSVPHLSVDWYAHGAVLTEPTAFGINPKNNKLMAGGEAGPEAVAPIDTLLSYIRLAVAESQLGIVETLKEILEELRELNQTLYDKFISALVDGVEVSVDNREIMRLVRKYAG